MNRLTDHRIAEGIADALLVIPEPIRARLAHVEFLAGVDPVFAGLHDWEVMSYGRSYRNTAHCAWRVHTSDCSTTIVLPEPETTETIIHELGHALDEALGELHLAEAVSWYAETCRVEAFAESFTAWLLPEYGDQDASHRDLVTRRLFEELAA